MTSGGKTLSGRHVVIVGGGSGMGRATATLAASHGAKVTIASRSKEKLETVAAEIDGNVSAKPVDMTDESALRAWAESLGTVDHLVISASSAAHGKYEDLPTDDLRGMIEAKFVGPYVTAREVLPLIREKGSITLFSGVLSRRSSAGAVGLGAVNAAVEALTRGLALELAGRVRVNCISPGMVDSDVYSKMSEDARSAMYARVGGALPVGRVGIVEEIAQAVLLTMTNDFMTGTTLDIDGGHMVKA
ncbi:MAG: SDR family oxidoreductase [Pseudomonadota bacterium]